ncbi:BQ5605_C017g08314 [Microbotryum silenes-dioicae]|uniref:BQ5605_C017g08314 protein n=1 Tax=Microbotryum silenes-dioicae TaxID=796604 RepID=A0A2X0LYY5_9BASI|nr:BQ5605_C017g08314 [Microbotryum silenes-dioicae]
MRMRMIRNSRQLWSRFPSSPPSRCLAPPQPRGFRTLARTVPATPKRIRLAIHTSESKKTDQRRHYLTTSSPHHSWLGKTRRWNGIPAFLSNIIFTTAEHNELRLRPLVPRKQKSEWKSKHDWAPRKYECCLAVVERPYEAWSQPAKVDLLWRFCGWPSLLGGLQKRSGAFEHCSTAMIIQAQVRRGRSVTY